MRHLKQIRFHVVTLIKYLIHLLGSVFVKPFLGKPDLRSLDRLKPYRILYVCLAYRGDLVINFPAISGLKRRFRNSRLVCWVRGYNESLARLHPDIDEVIVYDDFSNNVVRSILEFFQNDRHSAFLEKLRDFELYVDDSGYAFSAVAGFLAGVPYRVGRNFQGFGFLYHYESAYNPDMQLIERRLKLLRPLGIEMSLRDVSKPYFRISQEEIGRAWDHLGIPAREYFTVQPFAGWDAKNWGVDKYCRVATEFAALSGLLPIFIGSESERGLIAESLDRHQLGAINVAGSARMDESASLIAGARLHFGSDSVGAQLAIAMGVKSLAIFGPVNPVLCAYLGGANIAVLKRTKCTPRPDKIYCCFNAGRSCKDLSCMRELWEADVLRVLIDLWEGKPLPNVVEF